MKNKSNNSLNDCPCCSKTCDCDGACCHIHNNSPQDKTASKVLTTNTNSASKTRESVADDLPCRTVGVSRDGNLLDTFQSLREKLEKELENQEDMFHRTSNKLEQEYYCDNIRILKSNLQQLSECEAINKRDYILKKDIEDVFKLLGEKWELAQPDSDGEIEWVQFKDHALYDELSIELGLGGEK